MLIPVFYIEMVHYAVLGLLILTTLSQLISYLFVYGSVGRYKRNPGLKKHPVSVIICARNEAENLKKNLPLVLEQKFDNFEVIVVNDCSTDSTDDVLGDFLKKYKHLRVTSIAPDKKFTHGKKLAVTVGIKAAKNEWLVFTDADCVPVSDQWLNRMQENFLDSKEIVIAYGGYRPQPGLLNAYIRYDTLFIAMQYLGHALKGMPYMGVGRNLAYRKSLFFRNKGFASHYNILSGDDDLFINETATRTNTAVEFHPESHTLSVPRQSWGEWFTQKKRHYSTFGRYKPGHLFHLGIEPLMRVLFYFSFCYLLALKILVVPVLILAAVRWLTQLVVFKTAMNRLGVKGILLWCSIFDLISLFINFIIYLSGLFRRRTLRWK
ncbi:MAG: glycosyltransferase [Bacteroidales bacterium]|nr:glycosyltransferase [Bacteroidales bacterium]